MCGEGVVSKDTPSDSDADLAAAKKRFAVELNNVILAAEKRRGRGWDRGDLAKKILVSRSSVYAYLKGTTLPSNDTLERLLDALEATDAERKRLRRLRDDVEVTHRVHGGADAAADEGSRLRPGSPVPHQLPGRVAHFVGRTEELRHLTSWLDHAAEDGAPVVISAINGTAGVGKTALAVHWSHTNADRFPDGQLYVNLRGFDPTGIPMPPADAVRAFLDAFAVPPARIPTSLDAQIALYRTLLADRRMLVVLDNAHDSEQVRPLLPGSTTCLVIVTSRDHLAGLVAAEGARPLVLDLLSVDEARTLLARRLGDDRVDTEPEAVHHLITYCARLPLALAIVAARAALRPRFRLGVLAEELRAEQTRLDLLDAGDPTTNVRSVFSWSYQRLDAPTARMFRLLGLHPGPDLSASAAASLAVLPVDLAQATLDELTRAHLVQQHRPGRFALHDLLRTYALDQAQRHDDQPERHAARHRLLDHYLHTAHAASRSLEPNHRLTVTPLQPAVTLAEFASHDQALAWYEAERPVLLKIITAAAEHGFDTHAWQIPGCLGVFFDRRGYWHDWAATNRIGLDAARRLDDVAAQARIHRAIGQAGIRLTSYREAESHLRSALELFDHLDDHPGQGGTYLSLAVMAEGQKRYRDSLRHAQHALDQFQAADDAGSRSGVALALNGVGWYHALLGEHEPALTYCQQALALMQELRYPRGEAATWDSLGYTHHDAGHHDDAILCYQHALTLYRDLGDRYAEATTLTRLGNTHHAAADPTTASAAWQHALTILDDLQHPDADRVRATLRRNHAVTNGHSHATTTP
jgi:tetratricopeptide (TPR) repeat protein/transcriptional regulator with XRE-family HTH domain